MFRQGGGGCYKTQIADDKSQPFNQALNSQTKTHQTKSTNHTHTKAKFHLTPKFYFYLGVIFNLCLLGFFKYTDFFLENFNAFSQIAHLDFNIPLPHILLPLALSFVTFQQIAFLYDCFKRTKGELRENLDMNFIDYALFISFFPQLIAGPIVHHREMMPQFSRLGGDSSADNHCIDLQDFKSSQTNKSSSLLKPHKNSASTISHTKIVSNALLSHENSSSLRVSKASVASQAIAVFRKAKNALWVRNARSKIHSHFIDCHDLQSKSRNDAKKATLPFRNNKLNYEFLAKGIFIFSIGLFKKAFIADTFAKWANAGFSVVEKGEFLNIAQSWATSLSYTFQLYFDFSGYCDMAIGLGLMFGIVLPLNFNSPYKSLNIAEFWRRWHITLGCFLTECVYIPLGGSRGKGNSSLTPSSHIVSLRDLTQSNRGNPPYHTNSCHTEHSEVSQKIKSKRDISPTAQYDKNADYSTNAMELNECAKSRTNTLTRLLTLRNIFIVFFLSGIWHGAGWGFIIWGILHALAMMIHRAYRWFVESLQSKQDYRPISSLRADKIGAAIHKNKVVACHARNDNTPCHTEALAKVSQIRDISPAAQYGNNTACHTNARNDNAFATRFLNFTQTKFYKVLCWLITFNFISLAWVFFRAENLQGAINLLKGMFGVVWVSLPQKWHRMPETLAQIGGRNDTIFYLIIAFIVCAACKNSFELMQKFRPTLLNFAFASVLFVLAIVSICQILLENNAYTPFLYFNF